MRRFRCPSCGRVLIEGTTLCSHCGADTSGVAAPPSPGEQFPEVDFSTHQLAEEFAGLIASSMDDADPAPRFFPSMQLAPWGSPWMEQYFQRLEAGEAPCPPSLDLGELTLRDHLSAKQRQGIRHYLPKLQSIPPGLQLALVECLELTDWTSPDSLSDNARQWAKTLRKSGVIEAEPTEEERLGACSEDALRALLQRHGASAEGGRHELMGRVFDSVKPSDWQAFARAKLPGPLVRCKLELAQDLLTYLRIRRERIRLLVTSLVRRERNAQLADQYEAAGAKTEAFTTTGNPLPPFHPGCRCRVHTVEGGSASFLAVVGEPDACSDCAETITALDEAIRRLAQAETAGAVPAAAADEPVDFYADREWPWRCGMCPRCKDTMYKARRAGLLFHAFSECGGIWLPWRLQQELFEERPEIIGRLDTDFTFYRHPPGEDRVTQRCPDCETIELQNFLYWLDFNGRRYETDVQTHRCLQCRGIWFDHAELHLISKARAKILKG